MNRKYITPAILLSANLVTVYGIFFLNLKPENVFLIYWAESIVVFIYTIIKMFNAKFAHTKDLFPAIKINLKLKNIIFLGAVFSLFNYWILIVFKNIYPNLDIRSFPLIFVVAFIISHGISYFFNFIRSEEFKKYNYIEIFNRSFLKRSIVMYASIYLAILLFPLTMEKESYPFLIVFVIIKSVIDLYLHIKEHRFKI